ncbi:hypothetical protein STSR3_61 [Salmonella virus STSR3]|nr:hypothetical protein STSR3_61 [Salmonella virus STSR3]
MIAVKTICGVITDGKQYSVEHFTDSLYVLTGDDGKNYAVSTEHFESVLLHNAKKTAQAAESLAKKERERVRDNVLNAPLLVGMAGAFSVKETLHLPISRATIFNLTHTLIHLMNCARFYAYRKARTL